MRICLVNQNTIATALDPASRVRSWAAPPICRDWQTPEGHDPVWLSEYFVSRCRSSQTKRKDTNAASYWNHWQISVARKL